MESFSNTLSSQKLNMSIFDEQPSQNGEEDDDNDNDKKKVPFRTGVQALLNEQEVLTGEENEIFQHSIRSKLY
ncbi:hypothetical protein Glove_19g365 [Diversispora epigaea]|uniref:Uncharacterized protein n=1 Tax=Diversispora epigaea TaxID=1348612 RepID=A0A397JSH3_9GLOM|nr:hypothetical protein Glove_19g365 [Diversispora epigaea]